MLFGITTGFSWRVENVDKAVFHVNAEVDDLILQVEGLYIKDLEAGNRQKAMKRLRVPPFTEKEDSCITFRLGFFLGVFVAQLVVIGLTISLNYKNLPKVCGPANRIFRSTFMLIFFVFLIGINVHCWRKAGVNHILIFEIDPRDHITPNDLMEKACHLLVLWGCCVLYFIFSPKFNVPAYVGPFVIVISLLVYLFNPLPLCNSQSRSWFRRVIIKILLAPCYSVTFADFWLADQLNSLSYIFSDLAYFVCFFGFNIEWNKGLRTSADVTEFSEDYIFHSVVKINASQVSIIHNNVCNNIWYGLWPFLRALPTWFRFAQCLRRYFDNFRKTKNVFPHVINAGKYLSGIIVIIVTAFYSQLSNNKLFLWILVMVCIINTVYVFSWDILMDWGLFDRNAEEDRILRDELVYRFKIYYYLAIVENLMARHAWLIFIFLDQFQTLHRDIILFIVIFIEVMRRFIWNFFRLENEHLNNCGEFRAVRDIFIEPIRSSLHVDNHTVVPKETIVQYTLNEDSEEEVIVKTPSIVHTSTKDQLSATLFRHTKVDSSGVDSIKSKKNQHNNNYRINARQMTASKLV